MCKYHYEYLKYDISLIYIVEEHNTFKILFDTTKFVALIYCVAF